MPLFGGSASSNNIIRRSDDSSLDEGQPGGAVGFQDADRQARAAESTQHHAPARLPMAEVGLVNKKAQIRGTVSGIVGGLVLGVWSAWVARSRHRLTNALFAPIPTALVTRNVLRQSPNMTLVTGLGEQRPFCTDCALPFAHTALPHATVSGTSIGYFSSRAHLHTGMRQLQESRNTLGHTSPAEREMTALDLRAGRQREHEGGVAGLHDWHDRGHSTRGDH